MSSEIVPQPGTGIVPQPGTVPAPAAPITDTDTVPGTEPVPALQVLQAEDAGFLVLAARLISLSSRALRLKERVSALQQKMDDHAQRAGNLAEMCDAAEVDPGITAAIMEGVRALREVAAVSGTELGEAADVMQTQAQAAADAHESEYGGIHEHVQTMPVQQPKPGFTEVQ